MLAAGTIGIDDAERLLDKLTGSDPSPDQETGGESKAVASRSKRKYLRILVEGAKDSNVNIRVPFVLIRGGLKLAAILPSEARESLRGHSLDLTQLSDLRGEELVEALGDLRIDVDGNDGEKVRVFSE